jgi:hypothetical protein
MGEVSPGWRRSTLDTEPIAERTHTARDDWFAKAMIFAATSWWNQTVTRTPSVPPESFSFSKHSVREAFVHCRFAGIGIPLKEMP